MLTKEQAVAVYSRGEVHPDRLTQKRHGRYLAHAEALLRIYREGVGRTRRELHDAVRRVFADEPDCPPRRAEAFCKLLDEEGVSEFDRDAAGRSAQLRREVFRRAAACHPLVGARDRLFERSESDVKDRIASELGRPWAEIERDLFADVIDCHRLRAFRGYASPADLLSRYNVAQLQAALYDAVRMTVWAREDFKTILRYAKLARLLHRIGREEALGRYRIDFDGPASVLRETRRYGVGMAKFVPALLACRGWEMEAVIRRSRGGWKCRLRLDAGSGYRSHLPEPEEFDSSVEEGFARKWGGGAREGWRLLREAEILHRGQKVFVPDFSLVHEDGRKVLLEVVGFWTPEYLRAKLETVAAFPGHRVMLAVSEKAAPAMPEWPAHAVRYKTAIKLEAVLAALAAP